MTLKDKILMAFLGIITIGLYPAFVYLRKPMEENKELTVSDKITIDLVSLRKELGGSENIVGAEYTHTKVKLFVKNKEIVNVENVRAIKGISGVFATSKYVTIIVGNQAANLSKEI